MFNWLKIWRWRIFHRKKKKTDPIVSSPSPLPEPRPEESRIDVKPILYPSRNMALITTESDAKLRPIKVNNDHTIEYNKRRILIKPDRAAHTLDLNLHELMPTKKQKFVCRLFGIPKFQTYRMYTFQLEGELTHDPHLDHLTEEMKMKFEKTLLLVGKFAEADAGAVIYEGIKGPKHWWDYIPYIIICLIVAFFLFAFQVQPNL